MANALGYRFLDENGKELESIAENMIKVKSIDDSNVDKRLFDIKINVASDVKNVLYGEDGATAIYGKQKGVTKESFDVLDDGLKNIAKLIKEKYKKEIIGFCNAEIKSGIDAMLDIINFERELEGASLVITGEGAIDGQTKKGKVPVGVARRVKKLNKDISVIAIVGDIREGAEAVYDMGIDSIMPALKRAMPLEEAIANSKVLIEDASERALRFISINI